MPNVNNMTFSYDEYKAYAKTNKGAAGAYRPYASNADKDMQNGGQILGGGEEDHVGIDKVNPRNASEAELFALCSYADAQRGKAQNALGSWDALRGFLGSQTFYGENGEHEGNRDWIALLEEARDEYLKDGQYKQVMDGNQLISMLEKYGAPEEVHMLRLDEGVWVPVSEELQVMDLDGCSGQIQFSSSGEICYVNFGNEDAGWSMEVTREQLKKAQELGREFAVFMRDQSFWENYLNGAISLEELKETAQKLNEGKTYADFFNQLPDSEKEAWEEEGAESAGNGFSLSEFARAYMLSRLTGKPMGETMESILDIAKKAAVENRNENRNEN